MNTDSHVCPREGCDRSFETAQGLGQHISATHESDEPYKDRDTMHELYIERGLSTVEIGEELGISPTTARDWLYRLDIPVRTATYDRPPNFRTMSRGYEEIRTQAGGEYQAVLVHRLLAVAEYGLDAVRDRDVHHKNGIPWDNRPGNIRPVKRKNHIAEHHAEGDYDAHLQRLHNDA